MTWSRMLVAVFYFSLGTLAAQVPMPEGATGTMPPPAAVRMDDGSVDSPCGAVRVDSGAPGHEIALGELNAADHEIDDGWWHVGQYFSIKVYPDGLPNKFLTLKRGEEVAIVVRDHKRMQPRPRAPLEKITR